MNYKEVTKMMNGKTLANGKNEDGENVLISRADGCWKIETFQDNGWTRVNYIYEDGTVEELYEK